MANDSRPRTAKSGEQISAKAASRMRRDYPMMKDVLVTREATTVHPKSDAKGGQWACTSCGEFFQNNMQAQGHVTSHKLAWWTGTQFEEP